jgi:hypothetical protein
MKLANLARAERAGLMASSISKLNSESRSSTDKIIGKKREREIEDAKKERDEIRY